MNNCVCVFVHPPIWPSGVALQTLRAQLLPSNKPGLKRILAELVSLSSSRSHPHNWEATKMSGMSAAHWRKKSCRSPPTPHVRRRRTGTWKSKLRRRGVPARTSSAASRGHSVTRNGFVSSRSRVFPLHHRLPDDCCVFHASLKEVAQKKQKNKKHHHNTSFLLAAPTTKRCCLHRRKRHVCDAVNYKLHKKKDAFFTYSYFLKKYM